jgi:hypothetical protein
MCCFWVNEKVHLPPRAKLTSDQSIYSGKLLLAFYLTLGRIIPGERRWLPGIKRGALLNENIAGHQAHFRRANSSPAFYLPINTAHFYI